MLDIKKNYVMDNQNRPLAVQIDINTFERIEQFPEDFALGRLIEENNPDDFMSVAEAVKYYKKLRDENEVLGQKTFVRRTSQDFNQQLQDKT